MSCKAGVANHNEFKFAQFVLLHEFWVILILDVVASEHEVLWNFQIRKALRKARIPL